MFKVFFSSLSKINYYSLNHQFRRVFPEITIIDDAHVHHPTNQNQKKKFSLFSHPQQPIKTQSHSLSVNNVRKTALIVYTSQVRACVLICESKNEFEAAVTRLR